MAIRHIPDMFHGATMIRTETIKGAGIWYRVIGSRVFVPGIGFDPTVGVVIARLSENAQFWNAEHRVPAHVVTDRGAPLKPF